MLTLAINTASSRTGIAIFDNLQRLIAEDSWPAQNNEAEKLMPAIDKILVLASNRNSKNLLACKYSDIKKIYVIKGPGSFTGLRIGVTVANTITYLNKCELFGITTFEYWHHQNDLPVLIYAGSGGVYLSRKSHAEAVLLNLSELNDRLENEKITKVCGDITPDQAAILKNAKLIKIEKSFGQIMRKIIEKHQKNEIPDLKSVKIIQPLYIKEPHISKHLFILNHTPCSTSYPHQ